MAQRHQPLLRIVPDDEPSPPTVALEVRLDGDHFETVALRQVLGQGLGETWARRRLLRHFSLCCTTCLAALEEIIAGPDASRIATEATDDDDPLVSALGRLVELRMRAPCAPRLRPAHHHWAEKATTHSLAFVRLVLEEARETALRRTWAEVRLVEGIIEEITTDARLRIFDPKCYAEIEIVALVYLAREHLVAVDVDAAWRRLQDAQSLVDDAARRAFSPIDPEVLACLAELRASISFAEGHHLPALGHLHRAEVLLRGTRIRGRLGESLLHQARVWSHARSNSYAGDQQVRSLLQQALRELGNDGYPAFRLDAIHRRTLLLARRGRHQEALNAINREEELYRQASGERLGAQHLLLRGVLLLRLHHEHDAEPLLQQAVVSCSELRMWSEAARAVSGLAQIYGAQGRDDELRALAERFGDLLDTPAGKRLRIRELGRLGEIAESSGIKLPGLRDRIFQIQCALQPDLH